MPVNSLRAPLLRASGSALLVVGLVAALAACAPGTANPTSTPAVAADCTPVASGAGSDGIQVTGDFGAKPAVTIKSPVTVDATQRTVTIQGTGDVAVDGDTVNIDYVLYNGATGAFITGTDYSATSPSSFPLDANQYIAGLVKTIDCTAVGSRIVGVVPPADAFGDNGSTQLNVLAGQDIVFVVDVVSIAPPVAAPLSKADGADQPAPAGFPTVVLADDGTPTVTIPDAAPPTDLKIADLKLGTGAVIKDGDSVIVQYVGVNWNTKKVFDSSWARGETATFKTSQVIPGFTAALVGQTIGSQVIAIIPPDQGYGAAGSPPDIGGTDTLVFVVDILGVQQ